MFNLGISRRNFVYLMLLALGLNQVGFAGEPRIPGTLISNRQISFYLVPNSDKNVRNTIEATLAISIAEKAAIYGAAAAGLAVLVKIAGPAAITAMDIGIDGSNIPASITTGISLAGLLTAAGKLVYDFHNHPRFAMQVVNFAKVNASHIPTIRINSNEYTNTLKDLAEIGFTPAAESITLK